MRINIYSHLEDYEENRIIINPSISATMASGGLVCGNAVAKMFDFSVLDVARTDMSDHKGYCVKLYYNIGNYEYQAYCDFYVSTYEKMGNNRHKFQCTDAIGWYGEDYADNEDLDGTGNITISELAGLCTEHLGITGDTDFTTYCTGSAEIPKKDVKGKKYREILAIIAARNCGNIYIRGNKLSFWAAWLDKSDVESTAYSALTALDSTTFSRVAVAAGSATYYSGTGDAAHTFQHKYKYANQDTADIIQTNLNGHTYKAFKCNKCLIASNNIINTNYVSNGDVGDTFTPAAAAIMAFKVAYSPAGNYGTFTADVQKKTVDKPTESGESSGGGGAAIDNVSSFSGSTSGNTAVAVLTWQMPETEIDSVIIKRNRSTALTSPIDGGEIVYTGNGTSLTYSDTLPDIYHSWHYRTLTKKGDLYNGSDNSIVIAAITRGKYLYNAGDECQAITGYWYGGFPTLPNQVNGIYANWNNNYILMQCAPASSNRFTVSYYKARNIIDFSGFSKICAEIEVIQSKNYTPESDSNYTDMIARDMPYYNYADISSTATEYPYVAATYRDTSTQGKLGYWVYFSKLPFYFGTFNDVSKLMQNGTCVRVLYNGDGSGVYAAGSSITFSDGLNILTPTSSPDISEGTYMGGAYLNGGNNIYAMEGNLKVVSDVRFWLATKKLNNYDWSEKVSYAALTQDAATLGTHIVEMSLNDLDNTVNPPKFENYVTFGCFESEVKVHSIWLQE